MTELLGLCVGESAWSGIKPEVFTYVYIIEKEPGSPCATKLLGQRST